MTAFLSRKKEEYTRLSFDEKLVLLNIVVMFVPVFVSALSTLVFTVCLLTRPEKRRRIASVPYAWVLCVWAALSLLAGLLHRNYLGDAAFLVYLSFILFSFYMFRIMTRPLAERILRLACALSVPAFAVCVFQVLLRPHVRPVSTFFNANYYGFVCEVLALAAVYGLLAFRQKNRRILFGVSLAASLGGLWLSGCRTAWPALLLGIVVILLGLRRFKPVLAVLAVAAAAAAVLAIFPDVIPRISSMGTTRSLREEIWTVAWHGFLKYPLLGQGFMGYWLLSHGLGRADLPHAHNILLNALDSYGAVGVLCVLGFIIPSVAGCIRRLAREPLCALSLGLTAAILAHGVTDDPILGMQTGILVMTLLVTGGAKTSEPPAQT